ncbi:unnamed protein product, partial [Urochloa humidicola]
ESKRFSVQEDRRKGLEVSGYSGGGSPSTVMAVLERSSSPTAVAVAALIALASVAAVAGEVFFQEKFDDGWEARWVKSDWKNDDNAAGEWNHTSGKW